MEQRASLLGPSEAIFFSQDDKARLYSVAIGIVAANKQAPILVHLEYQIHLPDNNWVVASGHKLIPSVYAEIVIGANGLGKPNAAGYSGLTSIANRSGKHSSSTALAHGMELKKCFAFLSFDALTKRENSAKPILILAGMNTKNKLLVSFFQYFILMNHNCILCSWSRARRESALS